LVGKGRKEEKKGEERASALTLSCLDVRRIREPPVIERKQPKGGEGKGGKLVNWGDPERGAVEVKPQCVTKTARQESGPVRLCAAQAEGGRGVTGGETVGT